jgi:hypothetical protein
MLFFLIPTKKIIAQKTDTIYHVNGNILTGDFKKMVYGVVTWKMDGMGTINLEQIVMNSAISKKEFEIHFKDDQIYFGSMGASKKPKSLNVITKDSTIFTKIADIVEIYPIKNSVWSRMSGNFNLGANFSKGSNTGSIAFSGNLDYRKKKVYFNLQWQNNFNYASDSLSSSNQNIGLAWQRSQKNGWSSEVGIAGTQNSSLGTKLRLGLDLIENKDISYNNWNRLYAGAGLNLTRETDYGNYGTQNDIAGLIQLVWKVYKYTLPKVWVDANVTFIPYITDAGRYITNINLNPSVSILNDNFKVGFQLYFNYDSKPTETYSNNDYGVNLTFSYSFH